ncbi:Ubiquinone biosynthesis O-methyltransferase [subsurface metagenome]
MRTFQLDAALYDLMVDWSKRLENELPFFQYYFRKINTSSILDVACGSGRHSIEFAKIGYQITGIDVDPHMIELARRQLVHQRLEETNIRFLPVSFEEMINNVSIVPGPFHIITCIGNSISLLASNNSLQNSRQNAPDFNRGMNAVM